MIYCDKCKKEGVIDRMKNPPVPPSYSMQDVIDGKNEVTRWITADIKWYTRILECPNCGYSREYESGSGGLRPISIKENINLCNNELSTNSD